MNKGIHTDWLINAILLALLVVVVVVKSPASTVQAAGGGWETDGVLINAAENLNDRMVLVNTQTRNIAVYKTTDAGQFRLLDARDYKYDLLLQDSSVSDEIEKKGGISYMRAYELYELHVQEEERKSKLQANK